MKKSILIFYILLGFLNLWGGLALAQTNLPSDFLYRPDVRNIPWDEVRALYGDTVTNRIIEMLNSMPPTQIRELDKWTGAIHFEYKLPSGIPTGNVNLWVYDPSTKTITWSGPGPAPYSPQEALQKIQKYISNTGNTTDNNTSETQNQQISFLANGQTDLTVYPGDIINYTWRGPSGTGYTYFSDYTIDKEDNCGWGIKPGEKKPWYANTQQGSTSAVVQSCQADRTYTITYAVKNSAGTNIAQASIIVKVASGQRPPTGQRPPQQYNPFDVSYFGPTTIPGVTDRNQSNQTQQNQSQSQNKNVSNTNNAINSLSDIMSKINSVLEGVNNLSKEEKDVITKAIQSILDIIKDLIVNLTKRTIETQQAQNQSQLTQNNNLTSNTSISNIGNLRYLKVEVTEEGWIAFREIELYDENGNLITPVSAKASHNWMGYPDHPEHKGVYGTEKVYDRNVYTVWNSGETNLTDFYNCIGKNCKVVRSAWIELDLGESKNISLIRLLDEGWTPKEEITLKISNDGKNYSNLTKIVNNDPYPTYVHWVEYPTPQPPSYSDSEDPQIDLTVNDKKDISVKVWEGIRVKWKITNADEVSFSTNIKYLADFDPNYKKNNCMIWDKFPNFPNPALIGVRGNLFDGQSAFFMSACSKGETVFITATARQKSTGKTVSETVNINVSNDYSVGWGIESDQTHKFNDNDLIISKVGAHPIFTIPNNLNQTYRLQMWRAYLYPITGELYGAIRNQWPAPKLSAELLFASGNVSIPHLAWGYPPEWGLGQIENPDRYHFDVDIKLDPNISPGYYFVRITANKGQVDEKIYDLPIEVRYEEEKTSNLVDLWMHTLPQPKHLRIIPGPKTINVGSLASFKAWLAPTSTLDFLKDVSDLTLWSSSDPSILESLGNGQFKAKSAGASTITAKYNDYKASMVIKVVPQD
jgi:hypothetical protein